MVVPVVVHVADLANVLLLCILQMLRCLLFGTLSLLAAGHLVWDGALPVVVALHYLACSLRQYVRPIDNFLVSHGIAHEQSWIVASIGYLLALSLNESRLLNDKQR